MRRVVWVLGAVGLAAGMAWITAGGRGDGGLFADRAVADEAKASKLPPLKVDRSAPLLLEALPDSLPGAEPAAPEPKRMADNIACHVCHGTYDAEELALVHARENIGCVDCHGQSFAHRNDENNTTPPDKLFALDQIDQSCRECHKTHDVPAQKVIARWQERCPEKKDPGALVCTDCHGQHRMAFRTVRWNKKTRELIVGEAPAAEKKTEGEMQ